MFCRLYYTVLCKYLTFIFSERVLSILEWGGERKGDTQVSKVHTLLTYKGLEFTGGSWKETLSRTHTRLTLGEILTLLNSLLQHPSTQT